MTEAATRAAFAQQATSCADLGSAFMARLCDLLATRLDRSHPCGSRLFDWSGDVTSHGDSLPLRLCGALHALRLLDRAGLAATYPPREVSDDALWQTVEAALQTEATFIDHFLDSPPQTNEVRRATALIAASHVIADRFGQPTRVSELGASAGLNLNFDRFALWIGGDVLGPADSPVILSPEWEGPRPPSATPRITERRGVDLNPLDPRHDGLRLRAYLWADQPDRMLLTEAAMAMPPAQVDTADGVDWLAGRLPHVAGHAHMIFSTVAWQYFPAEAKARGRAMIEAAGATATHDTPLAWFTMEADGPTRGAAMTLRMWPGDLTLDLGRIDFHGRWVRFAL